MRILLVIAACVGLVGAIACGALALGGVNDQADDHAVVSVEC